jgi:multidrug efflux pump subunit AcrB
MTLGAIAALGLIIDDAIVVVSKSIEPMRSILKNRQLYYKKQFAISFQPW